MKLKVIKYDKIKARWLLALLKFSELFVVFLFVFGFHGLGSLVYNNFPKFYYAFFDFKVTSFGSLWLCGFGTFLLGIGVLFLVYTIGYIIYITFKSWFKANWRWAKILSEDEKSKQERLKEKGKLKLIKKIERMNKDRKLWGYCEGDIAVRERSGTFGIVGGKYEITYVYINDNGCFDCKECKEVSPGKFRFIKKSIPKKPKLSPIRQEELNEREK